MPEPNTPKAPEQPDEKAATTANEPVKPPAPSSQAHKDFMASLDFGGDAPKPAAKPKEPKEEAKEPEGKAPEPKGEPSAEPTKENDEDELFGGLKPEAKKEAKKADSNGAGEPEYPLKAKQWEEWKLKESERIRGEFEKQYGASEDLKTLREENERLSGIVNQVAYRRSPEYRKNYLEPKAAALARVEAIAKGRPDDQALQSVVDAMRRGTLTMEQFPDVKGLNQLQSNALTTAALDWMSTHEAQGAADAQAEKAETNYLAEAQGLEARAKAQAAQEISQGMLKAFPSAVERAKALLPDYTEQDQQLTWAKLSGEDPTGFMVQSVAMAVPLARHLRESLAKVAQLENELKTLRGERGGYANGTSMKQGHGAPGIVAAKRDHESFMGRIMAGDYD